tara:strand:+ start:604 stop:831 length:228 start_codon:yes stop_codon:yes gene_type:complete
MFLVIQKRAYSNIDSTSFDVLMDTKDHDLAIDFARCKGKEAKEKGDHHYSYAVVEFPDVAVSSEVETEQRINDLN